MKAVGTALGFAALLASLVVGSDLFGARSALFGAAAPPPRASAFSRVDTDAPAGGAARTVLRSQPWWQKADSFEGDRTTRTAAVKIRADAIQWRMKWSCTSGRFVVTAAAGAKPLIDAGCPAKGTTDVTAKPEKPLAVATDGPWQIGAEQQIDVPLNEPPLAAMSAPRTRKIASGSLYRVDQVGMGDVIIYKLPDGRFALRLQEFYVTPNIDLEVRLSPLRAPKSTRQYQASPSVLIRPLDVTTGSLNFILPRGIDPRRYRSVVFWCENLVSVYAAASLKAAR